MDQQAPIFALDIGTRSVIGVILENTDDGRFKVKDIKIVEHKERSMLDGQIHDVLAVSDTIKIVKDQLEANHGKLEHVSVAAAGRSLKTKRVKIEISIEGQPLLRKDDIRAFELTAVQDAQKQLIKDYTNEDMTQYHCVGYSVVNYFLDGEIIGSLLDQRGKVAEVEIIATFLPRVVVDSLLSSLKRADLEMEALTLEPIAAIHVLIPPTMRKLNIAFVDIGAGTSDIAITDEGTVVAYGMVPVAGDEITEALSQFYLLDFTIAEGIKRKLTIESEIIFTDIVGQTYTLQSEVILHHIDSTVENLASNIANKILELNKKPPQAVMLVGGGSQTPKLTEKVAEFLQLPLQRVAVRGADAIQQKVIWSEGMVKGPELVTPIGIGISSMENPIQYLTFYVNGDAIHLFEMKTLTVGDALIAAGIPIKNLFGKPGMAMTVKINGKIKMVPGEHGTLPEILVNDDQGTIDTRIKNGDKIIVNSGIDGKDATLSIEEALQFTDIKPYVIKIDGNEVELMPLVEINSIDAGYQAYIRDRDVVHFYHVKTIEEALVLAGYSTMQYSKKTINVQLNGEYKSLTYLPRRIYQNGQPIALTDPIVHGDEITFDKESKAYPTIKDIIDQNKLTAQLISVTFNRELVEIKPSTFQVQINGEKATLDDPIIPNSKVEVIWGEDNNLKFSDVFRYVNFDISNTKGSTRYVIKINHQVADFNSPIKQGDRLELYWE